ncbi:MAG: hypothetical protein OEW90_07545 [Betaproteobacteria bacterium]|nr:hypothetical protein [Betaproteobacteria bacterium]
MDFLTSPSVWIFGAIILGVTIVLQLGFEGLVLALGSMIVLALSRGRIRVGEARSFAKAPPKLHGGWVFYYENSQCYVYRNYAVLIGLVAVLLALGAIYGIGFYFNAH